VINLVSLFGISFKSAKAALTTNSEAIFLKGLSRTQTFNGIIQSGQISDTSEEWKLPEILDMHECSIDPCSKKLKV